MNALELIRALTHLYPNSVVRIRIGDKTYRVTEPKQSGPVILMGFDEDTEHVLSGEG